MATEYDSGDPPNTTKYEPESPLWLPEDLWVYLDWILQ